MVLTIIVSGGCVPKASDKKAVCGTNQAFDSVSRSCYSIAEIRYKPVATKTSETLAQETPKTITLTYTDKNNDQATSCSVTSISSNLEVMSPLIISGSLFTRALEVEDAADDLATSLVAVLPNGGADETAVLNAQSAMATALATARATYSYAKIIAQMGVFKTHVTTIVTIGAGNTSNTSVQFFYNLTASRLTTLNPLLTMVDNRCECAAGLCTTTLVPKDNQTGTGGFSYTVTDADGESASRSVTTTISAHPTTATHIKPVAESSYTTISESATTTPSSYAITLPGGGDLQGTTSWRYAYAGTKDGSNYGVTTNGKVWGCMDLTGSSGSTDKTCLYQPTSGNAYDSAVVAKATNSIAPLTFTALTEGAFGNSITVQIYNIQNSLISVDPYLSKTEIFGMISPAYNEAFVRVYGNAVRVFVNPGVTTYDDVRELINGHPQASKLVVASGISAATIPSATLPASTTLAAGAGAFDTIPFSVGNGTLYSDNTATVTIKMNPTDDLPVATTLSTSKTVLEDALVTAVDLSYFTDSDTGTLTYVNTCSVSDDVLFPGKITIGACTCVGTTCSVDITPNADVSGTYTLSYVIETDDGTTSQAIAARPLIITVTPKNDEPKISSNTTFSPVTALADATIAESTSTVPTEGIYNIYVAAGGGTDENSQTFTLTATSDNTALIPNTTTNLKIEKVAESPDIPGYDQYKLTVKPTTNVSGIANITITAKDSGGTALAGEDDEVTDDFQLTVTMVDDPPAFTTPITVVRTNEGGEVQTDGIVIDEDLGSSADEDAEPVRLTFTTDNTAVLPVSAITVFYDMNDNGVEDALEARAHGANLETAATDDVSDHKVYLKLKPVSGISGNVNITVTATQPAIVAPATPARTKTMSFSLVVHPIAALHGGWENIAAVGIKTDKNGTPVNESDFQCNYNKSTDLKKCSGSDCTGTSSPHGVIVPDDANVIFYDSSNRKCYRSTSASQFSWVDFSTSCPVTRIFISPTTLSSAITAGAATITVASTTGFPTAGTITIGTEQISYTGKTASTFTGATRGVNATTAAAHSSGDAVTYTANGQNLIEDSTSTPVATTPVSTAENQYYYDADNKTCHKSEEISSGVWGWDADAYIPSKITLSWKNFTISGSGADSGVQIAGWNVYRREKDSDYNFKGGHLKNASSTSTFTITDPGTRTFTDTTAVAGKLYFYVVRPVDNRQQIPTHTAEIFSEVRVLAPTPNYVFVHRWMINQEICNSMNMTTTTTNKVDPTANFRCPYYGPGDNGSGYYDYGEDLLVDLQEMGCPYTPAPSCSANGCVGIGAPPASTTAGDIYYDRSSGTCHINNGGAWAELDTAVIGLVTSSISSKMRSALNAPLTQVTQARSVALCTQRGDQASLYPELTGAITPKLPSKKDYVAYSGFPIDMNDADISDLEQGFSLNVASRCNSSEASGLETAYTDSNIPSTSFMYTLPGTAASGIRSLVTGSVPLGSSKSTESCKSRYGVQDIFGNVTEWTTDQMSCAAKVCSATGTSSMSNFDFDPGAGTKLYAFDHVTGPYSDVNADGVEVTDPYITDWLFADEFYEAGKFSLPTSMPISNNILTNVNTLGSPAIAFLLDIGPSSGITNSRLHDDGFVLKGDDLDGGTGSMTAGGSYIAGSWAGRWFTEVLPTTYKAEDVGFRCIVPVPNSRYPAAGVTNHSYPY